MILSSELTQKNQSGIPSAKEKARFTAGKDFRGDKHEIEVILLAIFRETLIYIKHVSGPLKISVFQRYSQQDDVQNFLMHSR